MATSAPVALWPRAWLLDAWRRVREMRVPGALSNLPPAYSAARRWSPLIFPVALWAALVLLGVFLASHRMGHVIVTWPHVRVLALLLLGLSVAYAVALRLAPNDAAWVGVLSLGLVLDLMASAFVLFGPGAGIVVTLVLAAGSATFVRQRLHPVREGTVHVTALPGAGHRTLPPGLNVLLPGERVLAILPVQPREHATLPQRLATPAGEVAEAAARVEYQLIPELAVRAVVATRDWERAVRQLLVAALRAELDAWLAGERGARDEAERGLSDVDRLRLRVEERMRAQALRWGVHIRGVELRDVTLPGARTAGGGAGSVGPERVVEGSLARGAGAERETNQDDGRSQMGRPAAAFRPPPAAGAVARMMTQPLPPNQEPAAGPEAPSWEGGGQPDEARGPGVTRVAGRGDATAWSSPPERWLGRMGAWLRESWDRLGQRADLPADAESDDALAQEGRQAGAGWSASPREDEHQPEEEPRALSPRILEAMYGAVEEGRISDPFTVRQIANSFAQLAVAGDPDEEMTRDPLQAAATLRRRAEELAAQLSLDQADPPTANAAPGPGTPPAPGRRMPPPRLARDENVMRGG